MNKARIKAIDRKFNPNEDPTANYFVIVDEDGQRWINGERVTKEQAHAYLQLAKRPGETFKVVAPGDV